MNSLARTSDHAEGRDIDDNRSVRLVKSHPARLNLFQEFLPEDDPKYSNSIEFYDAIPKYFSSKAQMDKMRFGPNGEKNYLETLKHEFRHGGEEYLLETRPARIEDIDGKEREYYPSAQEELVEEVLRKIACDRRSGVFLAGCAGVQFTMYELRAELHRRSHGMSLDKLKRSLLICRRAGLTIKNTRDGEKILDTSIFPMVMISKRKDYEDNPKNTHCYVQFNPLVTKSIIGLTYRQFDYVTLMSYKHQLSRWLHKRLYHKFIHAGMLETYNILLTTIKRDSKLLNNKRVSQNIKYLDCALNEIREKEIILGYEKETRRGSRNAIHDVKYTLMPSMEFVSEMKKANRRMNNMRENFPMLSPIEQV